MQQPGDATEKLVKNLASECQRVRQQHMVSGAGTTAAHLRRSNDLFVTFDEYYQLYHPHGGTATPKWLITEAMTLQ